MNEEKYFRNPLRRLFRLLKTDRRNIGNLYVFAVTSGLISLSLPLGIQAILGMILGGQMSSSWVLLAVLVTLGVFFTGLLQVFQLRITESLQQRIFASSALELAYRFPRISAEDAQRYNLPELSNRFFETMTIQKSINKVLLDFMTACIQILLALILLSLYHAVFILFGMLLLIVVFLIIRSSWKAGIETSFRESHYKYDTVYRLQEIAGGYRYMQQFGLKEWQLNNVDELSEKYIRARRAHFRILMLQFGSLIGFKTLVTAVLLITGSLLVMNNQINLGQFVAVEVVVVLILNAVEKLMLTMEPIYDLLTALEKLGTVTDIALLPEKGVNASDALGNSCQLELKNLSVNSSDEDGILKKTDFRAAAGEKILISGKGGSGKSLLAELLAGQRQIYHGEYLVNGINVRNINLLSFASKVALAGNRQMIYKGTLAENICAGRTPEFSRLKSVIQACGLEEFVSDGHHGFDQLVEPAHGEIPGSIRTRIILARCIYGNPPLLLIDDLLGRMEEEDGSRLMNYLRTEMKETTVICFSADADAGSMFDSVYQIENAQLIKKS